jgi:hypothetical protein
MKRDVKAMRLADRGNEETIESVSICSWRVGSLVFGAERSIDFWVAAMFMSIPKGCWVHKNPKIAALLLAITT